MGFTEVSFLFVFLPVSISAYIFVDKVFHKQILNNIVLVFLSLVFYYWANKQAMLFICMVGLLLYFAGQLLEKENCEKQNDEKIKAAKLRFPVLLLLGILFVYKYIGLIASWANSLAGKDLLQINDIIIPVGLSFIIFESISYLVDIYRGDAKAGNILDCFVFISLFPKIVSGPIVLWKDFKSQLHDRQVSGEQVAAGIDRIIVGYAKKAIIADTFGTQIALINRGIAGTGVDVPTMWLKVLLYFFQIYFDFSGYSDIALGICRIFGFSFKDNFKFPYLSESISEFWRRWHISLGSWFREYVYIPLGGNRRGNVYVHLLIVFILTGIWHGTGLQYLVWGGLHGIYIVTERIVRNKSWYKKTPKAVKWAFTIAFVFFTWVLFMSKDLPAALQTYKNMFVPMTTNTVNFTWRYYLSNRTILFLIVSVVVHIGCKGKLKEKVLSLLSSETGNIIKRVVLLLLFVVDILYIVNSTYSPFIYFQF